MVLKMNFEIGLTFILFFLKLKMVAGEYVVNFADVYVRNCLDENTYKIYPWPRRLPFEMSAYNKEDTDIDIDTNWNLYSLENTQVFLKTVLLGRFSVFHIKPFELKRGDYKIEISVMVNNTNKIQGICYLRIQAEDVVAIINGGTSRHFNPGEVITLDGGLSLDFCNPKEKKSLSYMWNCTQIREGFCNNHVATGSKFLIPSEFVVDKEVFRVNLAVKNEDGLVSMTYQELVIKDKSSHLSLACLDNCPPVVKSSNVKKSISFAVECEKYCEECKYSWYMYKGTKRDILIASSGSCSKSQCRFGADLYKDIGTYEVVYTCNGASTTSEVSQVVTFHEAPNFTCELNKNSGTSYEQFQVFCKYDHQENITHFEVFSLNNNTSDTEFITFWVPPFFPTFRLAPYVKKIIIRATNYQGIYDEETLPVVITPFLDINDDMYSIIEKLEGIYFDNEVYSVRYVLNTNNIEEAISRIKSIWTYIYIIPETISNNLEYKEFIYNFKLYVTDDLEKIPVTTYDELSEVANILQKIIMYQTPNKSDPLLANSLTTLCKKLTYDMKQLLEEVEHTEDVLERTLKISEIFLECGNKNSFENYDLITPLPIEGRSMNEFSVSTSLEDTIIEDYEDYEEFGSDYYEHLENLMEAVSNTIKINTLVGENVARLVSNGMQKQIKSSEDVTQLVYKQYGYEYPKLFEVDGVSVTVSEDIFTYENTVFISLTAWRKNIFWFSSRKTKPITYIVNIDLVNYETENPITISAPYIITLKITRDPVDRFRIINGEISAPLIYTNDEIDFYNRKYMKTYMVNLFRYQTLLIEFYDIEDAEFNVVIKEFELPTYTDIKRKFTVFNKNHRFGYYSNDFDLDSNFYVIVLPNKNMFIDANDSIKFSFKISFAGISCFSWSFTDEWTRACKAGTMTNKTHISCECDHLSTISGFKEHVRYAPLMEQYLDFEEHGHYSIFCSIGILFTIFCLLFLFSGERNKSEIYYAADNSYYETYAYLIVVATGGIRKTTARVVIKIVGTLNNTTHVLNYPDPECKLLNNGVEEWVVVTTKSSLGNITSIILWHDSYGIRPMWVCNTIVIYDMQTYEMWLFKVNATISAYHQPMVMSTPKDISGLKSVLKDRHNWSIFSEDVNRMTSYAQRLILVYSKLVTPLCLSVYCYCFITRYEITDESLHSDIEWFCFWMAILGGFLSFLVHLFMWYMFFKTRTCIVSLNALVHTTIGVILSFSIPLSAGFLIVIGWLLGVFADIILYENVKRYIINHLRTSNTRQTNINFDLIQNEVNRQREYIHERFGMSFMRILTPMHKYVDVNVEEKQYHLLRRQNVRTQVNEILMFGIYMILLYATVLTQKDHTVFYSHRTLQDLLKGHLTRTSPNIFEVHSMAGINNYINNTLIEATHPDFWYGDMEVVDAGVMADFNTKFIGVVRIRQHRVKRVPCMGLDILYLGENFTCYPDFTSSQEETGTYDGLWTKPTSYVPLKKHMWAMWTYKYSHEVGVYRGYFATYPTGGYTATLGRSKRNSHINYDIIKNSNWIDRATRTVITEFLTYNPNNNLFASVLIVMERSASGLVRCWGQVRPQRMVFVNKELYYTAAIVTIAFAAWIGLVLMNRARVLLKKGLMSLKNFWNMLDLIIVMLSVTVIVIYAVRIREVRKVVQKLAIVEHNGFVKYYHLFHLSYVMNVIEAILVFASTIRLWKLLRFMKMFQLFEKTLEFAAAPLIVLSLYHTIIFHGFALLGFMSFGESLKPFESHKISQITLLRIYLTSYTDLDPYEFFQAASGMGVALVVVYMALSYPIMQAYIMVEMFGYLEANDYYSGVGGTYSLVDYLKEEVLFKLWIYKSKVKRLRGGVAAKRNITRKSSNVFYSNCVSTTTDTMVRMSFVAQVVLLNILQTEEEHKVLSKAEIPQMLRICRYIFHERQKRGFSKQIFFKKRDPTSSNGKVKIVDARRVKAAKRLVDMILITPENQEQTTEDLIQDYDAVLQINKKTLDELRAVLNTSLKALESVKFVW